MANSFSGGGSHEYPERSTDHGQATGKLLSVNGSELKRPISSIREQVFSLVVLLSPNSVF
jgi:hypothetical protein